MAAQPSPQGLVVLRAIVEGTTPKPMYPDFLLAGEVAGKLLVNIINPHWSRAGCKVRALVG